MRVTVGVIVVHVVGMIMMRVVAVPMAAGVRTGFRFEGRLFHDVELKDKLAGAQPYGDWVGKIVDLNALLKDVPLSQIFRGVWPFVVALAVALFVVLEAQPLALWLPSFMK